MNLDVRLLVMAGLLAGGIGARHVGILRDQRRDRLNAVAYYVVLPALVFTVTAGRSVETLLSVELLLGSVLALGAAVAGSWLVHRRTAPPSVRGVAIVQSYHGNLGYLGLPLVALALGEAAAGLASVILGVVALAQIPLTVVTLVSITDADADVAGELRAVATNPILASLVVGLGVATLSLPVPDPISAGLGRIADLALPLALVLVGSSLDLDRSDVDARAIGSVVGLKVLCMPVVAWFAFTALGAPPLTRAAAVVMFGAPTAVSTYVYATELGGDAEFASIGVFATTAASVATLGVAVQFLG